MSGLTETDMNEIMKKMKETINRENRMKTTLENYEKFSNTLILMADNLEAKAKELRILAKEIDPLAKIEKINAGGKRGRKTQAELDKFDVIIDELFKRMSMITGEAGYVTRDYIENAYSELEEQDVIYLMSKLAKLNTVRKTKDGKSVRFFI